MLQNCDNRLCNAEIGRLSFFSFLFFLAWLLHLSSKFLMEALYLILKTRAESTKRALDHVWAPGAHWHCKQVIFSVIRARL